MVGDDRPRDEPQQRADPATDSATEAAGDGQLSDEELDAADVVEELFKAFRAGVAKSRQESHSHGANEK